MRYSEFKFYLRTKTNMLLQGKKSQVAPVEHSTFGIQESLLEQIKHNLSLKRWFGLHERKQKANEKMLNITHYQRNANQNHNEVPLQASQDGCYPKVYKQ